MVDADVVAIDDRMFLAISVEVSPGARKVRKGIRVNKVESKWRERAAARTITKIVSGDRRTVGSEYRPIWSVHSTAARKLVMTHRSGFDQFAKVADPHFG